MALGEFILGVGAASQGRPSQILNDYSDWTLNNNLDEGCSFTFQSRGVSLGAALIEELETDVYLYFDGVLTQRFRITSLTQYWASNGEDIIDVAAVCYRRVMKSRHVITPLSFPAVGQGDIIMGLINHTQAQPNGDLGITAGSLDNTVTRTRSYAVGDNIFDAITDLTRVENGVAWDIDANLQVIVRPLFDYPLQSTPIELGATARTMERPSNAEDFANVSIVSGDSEATNPIVLGTAGLVFDPRGRWEKVEALPGEQFQTALDERALGTLNTALSPPSTWTTEIVPFRYFTDLNLNVGDLVALVEPPSIAYRSGPAEAVLLQVVDRTINQTADGDPIVSVSGVEISAPNPVLTLAQARLSALGAAPNQKAAGGVVTTDGQFIYHTFTEADSFIPLPEFGSLDVECLLVGGGGGGGSGGAAQGGGGGGAGEVLTNVGSPIALTNPTGVFPGAGGLGGPAAGIFAPPATDGSPTVFAGFTAAGGGRGAGLGAPPGVGYPANDGASGGGAKRTAPAGGTGTAGNDGGSFIGTSNEAGGAGGGGAGAPGSDVDDIVSINKIGGAGGAGAVDTFLNVPTTRAGGGGGGYYFVPTFIFQPFVRDGAAGGAGGGGQGGGASGADRNGQPGVSGTGGGGGGGSFEFAGTALFGDGGNGGSGIVVIRYLA